VSYIYIREPKHNTMKYILSTLKDPTIKNCYFMKARDAMNM